MFIPAIWDKPNYLGVDILTILQFIEE